MLFSPSEGVNEREPTTIPDGALQDCDGAEYRVGESGLFVARGRLLAGTIDGVTGVGLYEAGFDGETQYLVAHVGNSYHYAPIADTLSFTLFDNLPTGTDAIVGAHYASRHYTANGVANRRLELSSGAVVSYPIGMSTTTFAIGNSVTGGTGTISATTGLEYWVTEYDSARGVESVFGSTTNTGPVSLKDSVIVTVLGVSANPRADTIRWYRSVDGGGYPDGGLIQETAIGTTQITDTNATTGTLTVPSYGIISVGGLDTDRDEAPPVMSTIFGPFQDSMLGVSVDEPRVLRFTPAGYPDSWPSSYGIPLETHRRDEILTGVILSGRIGVFCIDSVHVIYRLPRDSDSVFAAGEAMDVVTDSRGCVSRRGAAVFTPPGGGSLAAWVARDGIWVSTLSASPAPITDGIDWEGRVDVANLGSCRLLDDPVNRRLIFIYRRLTDTTYNTGLWYIDYQAFGTVDPTTFQIRGARGIRITFADHGPLADAVTVPWTDGSRRAASIDSRSGQVYIEGVQDADDSHLLDSSGSVRFRMRSKEFMPAGPAKVARLGVVSYMHDAGPERIEHRFYFNRRDSFPEVKNMPDTTTRNASDVMLGRQVNSFSLEIESAGTQSYGVHWINVEATDPGDLGGMKGA